MASTVNTYTQTFLKKVFWGPGSVNSLPEALNLVSKTKKALIITGRSLDQKTDVIRKVENLLGSSHCGTFANIGQHAPIAEIRQVLKTVREKNADVLVAVGGGSPIDSAKAVAYLLQQEQSGDGQEVSSDERDFLPIIAIPTTLSVAETTQNAGITNEEGNKTGFSNPALVPRILIYDAELTLSTPERLWLSSGMRAVDHAIEFLYRPGDSSILTSTVLGSIRELFHLLPASKAEPKNVEIRQKLQLACFQSLWPESRKGALGLSHACGHALGSTYKIPHGITSCLTLPGSIAITSQLPTTSKQHLLALSDALNFIPSSFYVYGTSMNESSLNNTALPPNSILTSQLNVTQTPNNTKGGNLGENTTTTNEEEDLIKQARARGLLVSQSVRKLIEDLGLHSTLREYNVPKQDFEKIAGHITKGGQDSVLHNLIVQMLNQKYEDKPEHL